MVSIDKFKELNASCKRELIFHIGFNSGFYSELNNMLLAIAFCLQNGIRFKLYSEDANFRYRKGWTDFFLPFCEEVTGKFHHLYNHRTQDPFFQSKGYFRKLRVLFYRMTHRHTYLTSDVFNSFRTVSFERSVFIIPELNFKGNIREFCRELIGMVYRFNEETSQEVQALVQPLHLPEKYVGFHIRVGDKFVEYPELEVADYIQKAESQTALRTAFVATDDYSIICKLEQNFPHWTFYTLTEPVEQGYFYDEYMEKSVEERRKESIKLFASMEILRNSTIFVGTFSSNMGMFIGMCKERAYGTDFDKWGIW